MSECAHIGCIDSNYPLIAGDWDITFQDLETKKVLFERYVLIRKTVLNELNKKGMKIIKVTIIR